MIPYIKQSDQNRLNDQLSKINIASGSELSYVICQLAMNLLHNREPITSTTLSEVMGGINGAMDEISSEIITAFIVHAKRENGNIFQEFIRIHNL